MQKEKQYQNLDIELQDEEPIQERDVHTTDIVYLGPVKQKACLSSYVGGISPNMRGQLEEVQNRTLSRGRAGRGSRRRNVSLPGVMCPLLYSRRNWLTTGTRLRVSMLLGSNRKRGNPSHLNRFEVGRSVLTYLNLPLGTSQ